jgi:hypothetical protein
VAVDVRIRVSNDVYLALTARAAEVGQSLAEYLRDELARVVEPVRGSLAKPAAELADLAD